mgnify:CR=1 FL=1
MRYYLEYLFFRFIALIVSLLGIKNVKYAAFPVFYLFYYLIPIRKKVVLKNLKLAFPNLPEPKIIEIAKQNYLSFAITFLEIMALNSASEEEIKEIIYVDNEDLIKSKFNEGRGLILLTAHFGNWELGGIIMKLILNHPLVVLSKRQKNMYVARWMKKSRERFGNTEIYIGISVRELYTALKNKSVVGIVGDQRAPQTSIKINFFNHPTPFFGGFTNLALKLHTPVIAAFAVRQADYRYRVEIHELDISSSTGTSEENIRNLLQQYADILQAKIISNPEQWFWMHNIWKYNH